MGQFPGNFAVQSDPTQLIVSASPDPSSAHSLVYAESTLYRRGKNESWQPLEEGLPTAKGTRAYVLATNQTEPGVFYAATGRDVYRSGDRGQSWHKLAIHWPASTDFSTVNALLVTEI